MTVPLIVQQSTNARHFYDYVRDTFWLSFNHAHKINLVLALWQPDENRSSLNMQLTSSLFSFGVTSPKKALRMKLICAFLCSKQSSLWRIWLKNIATRSLVACHCDTTVMTFHLCVTAGPLIAAKPCGEAS